MPYKIEEDGDKFCVVKEGGDVERCHDTRAEAEDHMKALYAAEGDKSYMPLNQAEVGYATLSATPGQACANCRWFQSFGDEYMQHARCHLVTDYPEPIEPTGLCQRWEAVPGATATQTATPAAVAEGEAALGKQQHKTLMERFRALLPKRKEPMGVGVKVVGNQWVITWSNNFEDRDGEIFTAKAIDHYVTRVDMGVVQPPEWWVWHTSAKTRIGQAAWVGRHGHFLIAAGEFDNTPQAQAAKAFYAKSKNAAQTGVSHGFTFPVEKFDGKHYHEFNTFEISTLPRDAEANRFTSLEGVKDMALDDKKRGYLEAVFGKEQAEKILGDLDERGKALEAAGVAFKDFVVTDEGSAAKDAVTAVEAQVKDLIGDLIGDNTEMAQQLAASGKAYAALDARMKAIETGLAAIKALVDDRPRSASKDEATEIKNDAVVAEVQQQFARQDAFWGTQVGEKPAP